MIRVFLAGVLIACGAVSYAAPAADQGQLDTSPALFAAMAAINAAGYDADLDSPANSPLRALVRQELAAKKIPCLADLKLFFQNHRQKDWTAELSQYISFALSVSGPPDFKWRFLVNQLPPEAAQLQGFEELLRRFWKEADLDSLWQKSQPYYEQALARYHGPAAKALLEVNAYLRSSTDGYLGRRFQVYLDLLGAPNQIHVRNYGDDYFVVLTPSPEPQTEDIRHAYLQYQLDPIVARSSAELNKRKSLIDFAQGAPVLEDYYKNDFVLLATASLIRSVEARLARKPELAAQALREGFILTPYFSEALALYEKQEQSMRFFFPEIAKGLDAKKETARLEGVQFATERPVRKAKVVPAERKVELTGARKTLEEAEQLDRTGKLEAASAAFRRVLQETEERPLHARAYYGLARIAARQRDPETSQKLFQKVLELSPDPETKAWTCLYLGRLADIEGDRDGAVRNYQAALAVENGPAAVRKAAEQGIQEAFKKK